MAAWRKAQLAVSLALTLCLAGSAAAEDVDITCQSGVVALPFLARDKRISNRYSYNLRDRRRSFL